MLKQGSAFIGYAVPQLPPGVQDKKILVLHLHPAHPERSTVTSNRQLKSSAEPRTAVPCLPLRLLISKKKGKAGEECLREPEVPSFLTSWIEIKERRQKEVK